MNPVHLASAFKVMAVTCTFSLSLSAPAFPQGPSSNQDYTVVAEKDRAAFDRLWGEIDAFINNLGAEYSYPNMREKLSECFESTGGKQVDMDSFVGADVGLLTQQVEMLRNDRNTGFMLPAGTFFEPVQVVDLSTSEQRFKDRVASIRGSQEELETTLCQKYSALGEMNRINEQLKKKWQENAPDYQSIQQLNDQSEAARQKRESASRKVDGLRKWILLRDIFVLAPARLGFAAITPKSLDGRTGKPDSDGALDFANQVVGTQSDPQNVTVRNVGKVVLRVGKIHLGPPDAGGSPPFAFDSHDCDAKLLPPGGRCVIGVQFAPSAIGSEFGTYELVIESDAQNSPHHVALTGTGTGVAPGPRPFSNSASYGVGNVVRYSDSKQSAIYRATAPNGGPNNPTPDKNSAAWTLVQRTARGGDAVAQTKGTSLPRLVVDRSESSHSVFNLCVTPKSAIPKLSGWQREEGLTWALSQSHPVRELWGQVVQGHVTTADAGWNHNSIDYNFFVYPDPNFRGLLANPGNFETGDEFEKGRIEVEWERSTSRWRAGFPAWAWPTQGDRIYVVGNFIRDCGHGEFSGGYRTEIHPPQFVATYRNAALADFGDASGRLGSSHNGVWANRVDVFLSNYGGEALGSEGINTSPWQAIGGKEYKFPVRAPPRPSPDAKLGKVMQPRDKSAEASYDWLSCEPTASTVDTYDCTVSVPQGVSSQGDVYLGETIYVFWAEEAKGDKPSDATQPANSAIPRVRSYRVKVTDVEVLHAGGGKWGVYAYVNEQSAGFLDGNGTGKFGEAWVEVQETDRTTRPPVLPLSRFQPTLDVSVIEGQPLHLQFRVIIYDTISGDNTMGGIAEAYYLPQGDPDSWLGTNLATRGYGSMNVGSEESELDSACIDAGCFIVRYRIEKLE